MQEVLIDSCGWVAIVDSGINIDTSLNGLVGPFQLLLLENVKHELDDLANEKKNLLLPLIYSKSEIIKALEDSTNHTDDQFTQGCKNTIGELVDFVRLEQSLTERGVLR